MEGNPHLQTEMPRQPSDATDRLALKSNFISQDLQIFFIFKKHNNLKRSYKMHPGKMEN